MMLIDRRALMPLLRLSIYHRGLTLLETAIALALIAVLLSILLPALSTARQASHRDQCATHLKSIGEAWQSYLGDHDKQFPFVPLQPGWFYGGVRFSRVDGSAFPDFERPLNPYLGLQRTRNFDDLDVCCPSDRGISAVALGAGTGERSAFESYGTSYRANAPLLDAPMSGVADELRGMRRSEITTSPSRLVLCGDAVWYEVAESTGRHADWHGVPNAGNILFLDGSVRFMTVKPKSIVGPMLFDPIMPRASETPASSRPAGAQDGAVSN